MKDLGANVNAINKDGRTALMLAAFHEQHSAVKSLLKYKCIVGMGYYELPIGLELLPI